MPKKKSPQTIDPVEAIASWITLKANKARVEREMGELEKVIKPFLEEQEDKSFLHDGWLLKVVWTFDKESFSLSKAKEKIDGRVLAPYISHSTFSQIRTTWKGGKE